MTHPHPTLSLFAALILCVSLVSGGVLHAVIPHSHGQHIHSHSESHSEDESPLWSDLHHALTHEDKKAFAAILSLVIIVFLGQVLVTITRTTAALRYAHVRSRARDSNRGELLRTGIHPYRKFR